MYHNQSIKAGNMGGGANQRVDHQQKKYNTIDASVQNMGASNNNNLMSQSPAPSSYAAVPQGVSVSPAPVPGQHGVTAETAGTSNPSYDANANAEFIDIMRKVPRVLCERYELMDVLGKGAHGRIYLATDLVTHERVAIKLMEKSSKNKSKFQREISLMKDMMKLAKKKPLRENCVHYQDPETVQLNAKLLQQQQANMSKTSSQTQLAMMKNRRIGFPRLFSYCSDQNYYYLVMQLLGVNLKELKESFKECKFSIQTVIIIALQLMNRLNSLHSQGYIHRDLKPANVVIGNESNEAHFIYLIDFGLAKKEDSTNPPIDPKKGGGEGEDEQVNIIDPKTGKKKTAMQTLKEYMDDEKDNFRVVGTAMYAALAAHLPNKKYLKKDDIESLLFLLSYFGVGQLPWRYKTNQEGLEKMMHYKYEISPNELFPTDVFPKNFQFLYEYIRALPDDEEADYTIIERELMQAAHQVKVDPSLLIALDWMNCKPIVAQLPSSSIQSAHNSAQQPNRQMQPVHSPNTVPRPGRQINNSQMSKNSQNPPDMRTPIASDKNGRKQQFTMTPDIHTKTYAERSGLGGIASGMQNSAQAQQQQMAYSSLHQSGKARGNMTGLTIGGQSIGKQAQTSTGVYGHTSIELDSMHGMGDNQEDLMMMNIPREGNADQLNKSTKLTLSSKKQYDAHMQNIPTQGQQQYMQFNTSASGMSVLNATGHANRAKMNSTMMVNFNNNGDKGGINVGANAANVRSNLNKSTLLPSNFVSNRVGLPQSQLEQFANLGPIGPASVGGKVRASNGGNMTQNIQVGQTGGNHPGGAQLKLNPNLVGNNGQIIASGAYSAMDMQNQGSFFEQSINNQQQLDHMNRSLNMHQMQAAFKNNNGMQQSPPNIRATANNSQLVSGHIGPHHHTALNSATHHKFNNMFEKNKSAALNLKVQQTQPSGPGQAGYLSSLQTIQNSNAQKQNFLPQANGATKNTNTSMQQAFVQAKNKERYVQQQQQQFYQQAAASSTDMQNQMSMMHQSPTLSPTGGQQQTIPQGQNMSFQAQSAAQQSYNNYKQIKMVSQPSQQYGKHSAKSNGAQPNNNGGNQSQFGSRLSHNTSVSANTTKKSAGGNGVNSQKQGNNLTQMSTAGMSPLKGANQQPQNQLLQQQQSAARQSKNSSALGIIGGNIVSNNQGASGANQSLTAAEANTSSQGNMMGGTQGVHNQSQGIPFNMNRQKALNKSGMMYNTMYGSSSATTGGGAASLAQSSQQYQPNGTKSGNGGASQRPGMGNKMSAQAMANPIHIKIEDQTGVYSGGKAATFSNPGPQSYSVNAVSPNPGGKQQFQQTGQKFGSVIKAQNMGPGGQTYSKTGPNSVISTKKNGQVANLGNGPGTFSRNKSKSGLGNQTSQQ